MTSRDVAVVGFAHAPHVRRTEGTTNGVEMLMPCFAELYDGTRPQADRHRLLVLRILGLPCRPCVLVHLRDRLDRCGAADQRVARRDGRGMGALRGLHQDADRRGRHRAGLRLRQVLGGHAAPGAGAADRPVHRRAAVARLGVDRPACRRGFGLDAGKWTAEQMAQVALDSFAVAERTDSREARPRASTNCSPGRTSPIRCAATTSRRSPTAPRRSCWPRATGPASCARTPPGSPVSSTASRRRCWAPAT